MDSRDARDGGELGAPLSGALLSAILESADDAIVVADRDGRILLFNDGAARIFGYPSGEMEGQMIDALLPEGFREAHRKHVKRFADVGGPARTMHERGGIVGLRSDGTTFPAEASISCVHAEGRVVLAVILRDVTQRKQLEGRLADLALHDPLTGLANRTLLMDRLHVALRRSRRARSPVAVLFVDLDGFKDVNDRFGHGVGDDVLREVAARITLSVRAEDTVARLGGDEFIVVSADQQQAGVAHLARRILAAVAAPIQTDPHTVTLTASIGIAVSPAQGQISATEMIRVADAAMYAAKARGGDRIQHGSQLPALSDEAD